jgi:spore germination cell wall hydrolase CwlJ-like protein
MKCLVDNVYYESRGEPVKGQMLVARVTINRAKWEHNGDICKAVHAPYQFSWTLQPRSKPDPKVYAESAKAAYAALYYYKPVYYFHNKFIKPEWAKRKLIIAKVGNHIFYE